MAFEQPGFAYTREAAADLSASQHLFVAINSSSQAAVAGAGVAVDGVLQNNPDAQGKAASIMRDGISKVRAGAAVAAGALVASNASGQAVTAATGNVVAGKALSAAGAANEVISVLLGSNHVLP